MSDSKKSKKKASKKSKKTVEAERVGPFVVTGGAGFVGSRLCLKLQELYPGARIMALDNFSSGCFSNLEGFKGETVYCDIKNCLDLASIISTIEPTAVFHQAAITDTNVDDPELVLRTNVEALETILGVQERLCEADRPSFKTVYASSSAVYGQHPNDKRCTVGHHEFPLNMYGFSKLAQDNMVRARLRAVKKNEQIGIVGLRYFNIYGPGEVKKGKDASYLYQIWNQLHGNLGDVTKKYHNDERRLVKLFDGSQTAERDWVHVDDVVRANIEALKANDGIYNVGSGERVTFTRLIGLVGGYSTVPEGTEIKPQIVPNNRAWCYQRFTCAGLKATRAAMPGFKPRSIKDGIKEYVAHLEEKRGAGT